MLELMQEIWPFLNMPVKSSVEQPYWEAGSQVGWELDHTPLVKHVIGVGFDSVNPWAQLNLQVKPAYGWHNPMANPFTGARSVCGHRIVGSWVFKLR